MFVILGNENIQLYINEGKVFLPTCVKITKIYVQEKEDDLVCTKFPQVYFDSPYSNRKIRGYIRFNNILTQQNQMKIDCTLRKSSIVVDGNNQTFFIIKANGSSQSAHEYIPHLVDLKINNGNLNNYFEHHSLLFNGSDFYERINKFFGPMHTNSIDENTDENNNNVINHSAKVSKSNWSFNLIEIFFTYANKSLLFILTLIIIFFIFLIFIYLLICKFKIN